MHMLVYSLRSPDEVAVDVEFGFDPSVISLQYSQGHSGRTTVPRATHGMLGRCT